MEAGEEEVIINNKGRMELENKEYHIDYSETGPNKNHTPKPPSIHWAINIVGFIRENGWLFVYYYLLKVVAI